MIECHRENASSLVWRTSLASQPLHVINLIHTLLSSDSAHGKSAFWRPRSKKGLSCVRYLCENSSFRSGWPNWKYLISSVKFSWATLQVVSKVSRKPHSWRLGYICFTFELLLLLCFQNPSHARAYACFHHGVSAHFLWRTSSSMPTSCSGHSP